MPNKDIKRKAESLTDIEIPTSIFLDRTVSILEALSEYLKDTQKMTYHEIAVLLNRDDRTIWTSYTRAKAKKKNISEGIAVKTKKNMKKNRQKTGE